MPWLWPKPLFDLLPDGREHSRCLNIVHQFTRKVINDRARAFQADEIHGKRPVFLGKSNKKVTISIQFLFLRFSSQTNARRTINSR